MEMHDIPVISFAPIDLIRYPTKKKKEQKKINTYTFIDRITAFQVCGHVTAVNFAFFITICRTLYLLINTLFTLIFFYFSFFLYSNLLSPCRFATLSYLMFSL
ncbi:hypothetical protein BGW37DRAFT_496940 [Umbelopsis sp. PMI_123]|nr:hypothetical protein BGW37DRAFT_496940 [Umbelopsis sp. PMI_123]